MTTLTCDCGPEVYPCGRYPGDKHWDAGMCEHGKAWMAGHIDDFTVIDPFAPSSGPVTRYKTRPCRWCDEYARLAADDSCPTCGAER